MGMFCSCLQGHSYDSFMDLASSAYQDCVCLRCFTQQLIQAYTVFFQAGELEAIPVQETPPVSSIEASTCDTYRSPPRPLPYDDPRFSRPQRDWPAAYSKSSSPVGEETGLLTSTDIEIESPNSTEKSSKTNYANNLKKHGLPLEVKLRTKGSSTDLTHYFLSSEEEDVCPTCLEEYSLDNPRIVMQCSHHFHLGCIYEWMERSDACPVCGKAMMFNESV